MFKDIFDFDFYKAFSKHLETHSCNKEVVIPAPMDELYFEEWFSCN